MSKSTLGTLAVIILIGLGIWMFMGNGTPASPEGTSDEMMEGEATTTDSGAASGTVMAGTETYTIEEIATHNNAESCWSAIEGGVYDLTEWINKHPGGPQAILGNLCGKDGTAAFEQMHGNHPTQKPQTVLATFQIGALAGPAM